MDYTILFSSLMSTIVAALIGFVFSWGSLKEFKRIAEEKMGALAKKQEEQEKELAQVQGDIIGLERDIRSVFQDIGSIKKQNEIMYNEFHSFSENFNREILELYKSKSDK